MNEENNMENMVNQQTINNYTSGFNTDGTNGNNGKKSNKKIILLVIAIVLALLIVFGVFYYFKVFTRTDQFYKRIIGSEIDSLAKQLSKEEYKSMEANVSLDADVNLTNSMQMAEIESIIDLINKAYIDLDIKYDMENQKLIVDLESDYDNQELLNLQLYSDMKTEKAYLHLGNLLNKYIELELDDMDFESLIPADSSENLTFIEKQNAKKFINELKKEILGCIKQEYCSNEKIEIEVAGETIKATKNTLRIGLNDFTNEFIEVLRNIKDNEKMLDCLTEEGKTDIKNMIDGSIESLEATKTEAVEDVIMEVNVYTKGFFMTDIVRCDFNMSYENNTIELLSFEKESEDEWLWNISLEDSMKIYGTVKLDENGGSKINVNVEMEGVGKASLNLGYNLVYNVEIESVNVNNSSKLDEFTEQEQTTLMANLQSSKLYELILPFMDSANETVTVYSTDKKQAFTVEIPQGYTEDDSYSSETYRYLSKGYSTAVGLSILNTNIGTCTNNMTLEKIKEELGKQGYTVNNMSDVSTLSANNKTFYTVTYDLTVSSQRVQIKYIWVELSNEYVANMVCTGDFTSEEMDTILSSIRIGE